MKPTSSQPVRAAISLRISLDREMDGLAIDRQREDCEKLAQFRGWEIVETYVDQSISASDKTKKRPAYLRMVADYEAGLLDAIVCYDLDRLTRQPRELEDWIDRAESRGLLLVTANGDADLGTDGGRMYARIKAAVARAEVERKGARQSRAHVQRARQGRPPKGVRPMGYTTAGELIPHEAEAVRAIYAAFLRGDSLHGIARALSGAQADGEAAGVPRVPLHSRTIVLERNARRQAEGKQPRPVPDDKSWSPSTVLGILRNPRYAGYSVYTSKHTRRQEAGESRRKALRDNLVKDENGELVLGRWEAIVEADQWWTVQNLLDDPARVTNRSGFTVRKHLQGFTGAVSVGSWCEPAPATTAATPGISTAPETRLTTSFGLSSSPGSRRRTSGVTRSRRTPRSRTLFRSRSHSSAHALLVLSETTTPR